MTQYMRLYSAFGFGEEAIISSNAFFLHVTIRIQVLFDSVVFMAHQHIYGYIVSSLAHFLLFSPLL